MKLLATLFLFGTTATVASPSCPVSPITKPILDGSECDCRTQEIVPERPDAITPTPHDECGGCLPSQVCVCETDNIIYPTAIPPTYDCAAYKPYTNSKTYAMGDTVHLNRRVYRARSVTTGEQPGLAWAWEELGQCKDGTMINCSGIAPWTCDTPYNAGLQAFYDHSLWIAKHSTAHEPSHSSADWEFAGLCA